MLTAIVFACINLIGYILAYTRGPFWALLVYANIYFNYNTSKINWWTAYLPFSRWSLMSAIVLVSSAFIHKDKLSSHKMYSAKWCWLFLTISIITLTWTPVPQEALSFTYKLLTYCISIYLIIRVVSTQDQYRLFNLSIIFFVFVLSLKAYFFGERIGARLENIGVSDAPGANEFGLMAISVVPLVFPFIFNGRKYEKIVVLLALPFIINAFILCNSRGALVSFILALSYIFIFIADRKAKKYILLLTIGSILLTLYLADDYFLARMSTLSQASEELDDNEINQLSSGRIAIWKYGLLMARDYPFGAGPNAFKHLARFYLPDEMLTYHSGSEYGIRAAHNTYLQVLVEQGVAGIIVWALICGHTLFILYEAKKSIQYDSNSNSFLRKNLLAINTSLVVTLAGGLFGNRVEYEFFWWQIALSIVCYSFIINDDQNNRKLPTNNI